MPKLGRSPEQEVVRRRPRILSSIRILTETGAAGEEGLVEVFIVNRDCLHQGGGQGQHRVWGRNTVIES